MTDIKLMPVDLAVWPADAVAGVVVEPIEPIEAIELLEPVELIASLARPHPKRVVIVRRRSAHDALLEAELRNAPEHEVRLLEEAAIAASMARVRAVLREGGTVTTAERQQFERDCELMRRFPGDRRGVAGEGWFHLPH